MNSKRAGPQARSPVTVKARRGWRIAMFCLTGVEILCVNGGCQHAGEPARIAVVGTVTTESGEPIDGMISFLPQAGTKGPAATASLIDGSFEFDKTNGPVAGKYRVLVVRNLADVKYKGASSPAVATAAPAAMPQQNQPAIEEEWSFDADVSIENFEFDFDVS